MGYTFLAPRASSFSETDVFLLAVLFDSIVMYGCDSLPLFSLKQGWIGTVRLTAHALCVCFKALAFIFVPGERPARAIKRVRQPKRLPHPLREDGVIACPTAVWV
jgi:hypothetical protein